MTKTSASDQSQSTISIYDRPIQFIDQDAWKRFGLITLATDLTCERDFSRLIPHQSAGLYGTRVAFENPTTPENLRKMLPRIADAAKLILPSESLDAICYSCTAATVVIGDEAIIEAIHRVKPGVPVVTPSGAAMLAFSALNVTRIAVITPYLVETSQPFAEYFSRHGFEVSNFQCFGIEDDRAMALVSCDSIVEAACHVDTDDAEAIFISCTALPSVVAIDEIERRLNKPVVTSNQASAWAMLRHAGLDYNPHGYGRLFEHDLPK